MNISLEKYEAMQDRIANLEVAMEIKSKQFEYAVNLVVERDELIYALRAKQPHWISAKGRLPEDDGEVLAYDGEYAFISHFCRDGWYDNSLYQQPVKVTHWMPLPEPPEV